jgi:hypothetical protein
MSAYPPPANWNPIFDSKKFFNIPTGNMKKSNTEIIYQDQLDNINQELEISSELLNGFSFTPSLVTPFTSTSGGYALILDLEDNGTGSFMITVSCCLNLPVGVAWNYAVLHTTYTSDLYTYSNQPVVVYGYTNASNGTLNLPTLTTTFFYNVNQAATTNYVALNLLVVAPAPTFTYTGYFGTSYTSGSNTAGNQFCKTNFTNEVNVYQR